MRKYFYFIPKNLIVVQICIILLFISGCGEPHLYDKNITVNHDGWKSSDRVDFETLITDTIQAVDFYINVRHNTDYSYRNLYLFLHTRFPSGQQTTDTLEIILATADGMWHGKGFGSIKENKILLKRGVYFPVSGKYIFSLEQGMREESLPGIEDIGITINKRQK